MPGSSSHGHSMVIGNKYFSFASYYVLYLGINSLLGKYNSHCLTPHDILLAKSLIFKVLFLFAT